MTAKEYVAEREITPDEIALWHLDVCEEHLGYPLLNVAGVYCCTIKRMFVGQHRFEYPKDYPIHLHLFGIHQALPVIQTWGFAFAVEGPLDTIAMHRLGAKNTIGYLGNHLTKWQALSLARWTDKVVVIPDADAGGAGGLEKTKENIGSLLKFGTIKLPAGYDPDKMARKHRDEFRKTLQDVLLKLNVPEGTG